MREITVKYTGKCADTGRTLPRGTRALYDPGTKKLYAMESPTAKGGTQYPQPGFKYSQTAQDNNPDAWINQALIDNYNQPYR